MAIQGSFPSHYEAYFVSHDGEGDDIQALVIASLASQDEEVTVDCTIGYEAIVHVSATDKQKEMAARRELTEQLFFGRKVSLHGAEDTKAVSGEYVTRILENAQQNKNCLVLHTDSFASLFELFTQAKPGELKNVVILSYGAINLGWMLPKDQQEKEKVCRQFYEMLEKSGAKMIQVEGFPFLGKRNKLTPANTPVTFSLFKHLDGTAGQKWREVNSNAVAKILEGQAKEVSNLLFKAMDTKADLLLQEELKALVRQLLKHIQCDEVVSNAELLATQLNRSLPFEQHVQFEQVLTQIAPLVAKILEKKQSEIDYDFNIYAGTSLQDQGLIADQIPALLFSELKDGQTHGLLQECLPVEFSGLDGRFLTFAVRDMKSSLFYLKTKDKIKQEAIGVSEELRIEGYLKYIDLSLAAALLAHPQMITPQTKEELFRSPFKKRFEALVNEVQDLGYSLPSFAAKINLALRTTDITIQEKQNSLF